MVIEILVDHFNKISIEIKSFKVLNGAGEEFFNFLLIYSRIPESVVLQEFDHWL